MTPLLFILVLCLAQILITSSHIWVVHTLTSNLNLPFWFNKFLIETSVILSTLFTITSTLCSRWFNRPFSILYYIASVWMGTFYWLAWAALISILLYYLPFIDSQEHIWFNLILIIAACSLSLYGLHRSYQTTITRYTVGLPNLPASWISKKVVLIADIHLGNIRNKNFAKKTAQLISIENPHAIFIAGDLFDGPPANYSELAKIFGDLKTGKGIFYINGNHEEFTSNEPYIQAVRSGHITPLLDQKLIIDGLQLIGVGYFSTRTKQKEENVLESLRIDPTLPTILLRHVPNHLEIAQKAGVHLQLSGHVHQGQVFPINYVTRLIFKGFDYGMHRIKSMVQITTSGVGTWGPPQRIGTKSEIVVIELKSLDQNDPAYYPDQVYKDLGVGKIKST